MTKRKAKTTDKPLAEKDNFNDTENACTMIAIQEVTQKTNKQILSAATKRGYTEGKGMKPEDWRKVATDLGFKQRTVSIKTEDYRERAEAEGIRLGKGTELTINQFRKLFPEGTYFLSVKRHAIVLRDGHVVEVEGAETLGHRRRLRMATKVLSPAEPAPLSEFLAIPKPRALVRRKAKKQKRWMAADRYLRDHKNVTLEQLVLETPYTMADAKYDMAKGWLKYAPKKK